MGHRSVTTPIEEPKAFQRVGLRPGEARTICREVPYEHLALVNRELEMVVEPGEFEVMVGGSSRDVDLLRATFEVSLWERPSWLPCLAHWFVLYTRRISQDERS